jgi:hypothetical protein
MGYNDLLASKGEVKNEAYKTSDFRQRVINPSKVNKRNYDSSTVNKTRRIGIGRSWSKTNIRN